MGARVAQALGMTGQVEELVIAGRAGGKAAEVAGVVASTSDTLARAEAVDGTDVGSVAALLRRVRPDLVVQCATLLSPWALYGRDDPFAVAFRAAGLGVALPMQLPVLRATMQAVRDEGLAIPVANLSFPDVTNVILGRLGLAPTCGLGNASIMHLRVRAALRAELGAGAELPAIRVVGQHGQLFGVLRAAPPAPPDEGPRVYLGADGTRRDELAYRAQPIEPGWIYNAITVGAVVPTLLALLPDAAPLAFSVPAPQGLPGGYPVRIADRRVTLDLPPGAGLADAIAFNERAMPGDGVARVDADGTAHVTDAARATVADVAPWLAEPLHPDDALARAARIAEAIR